MSLGAATRKVAATRARHQAAHAVYLHAVARARASEALVARLEHKLADARAELVRRHAEERKTWPSAGRARNAHWAALDARRVEIVKAIERGETLRVIGAATHLHPSHVSRIARGERS